jgi:hypothetical protein
MLDFIITGPFVGGYKFSACGTAEEFAKEFQNFKRFAGEEMALVRKGEVMVARLPDYEVVQRF